jgi:glyoxylase-like metal-dependent hydrolase (beta-lactamase superfamily II)
VTAAWLPDGVERIAADNPGPLTGAGNVTYLWRGRLPTLIDAGVGRPAHLEAVAAALGGADLAQVLVTHAHSDHAAGAPALLARWPETRVLKRPWPERDAASVRWGTLADGDHLEAGDAVLEVVHTPGHSPDHVCLWHAASRTLFGGDLLVAGSTVLVPGGRGGHLADYLASLARVARLAPRAVLPAHGPVIEEPLALIARYTAHRARRDAQILDAIAAGDRSVTAVVARVYPELMPDLRAAAGMTVAAHLDKLRAEGRVEGDDGSLTIR